MDVVFLCCANKGAVDDADIGSGDSGCDGYCIVG